MVQHRSLRSLLIRVTVLIAAISYPAWSLAQSPPTAAPPQARLKLDCVRYGYIPIEKLGHLSVTAPASLPPAGGSFPLSWTVRASRPIRFVHLQLTDLTIYNHPNRFAKRSFRYAAVARARSDSTTWKVPAKTGQKREFLRFRLAWETKKAGHGKYAGIMCDASVPFDA